VRWMWSRLWSFRARESTSSGEDKAVAAGPASPGDAGRCASTLLI